MDREVKELQLFLALQEYPLFSSSPLHRILVDALTRDNFLFPFCTITSIDCEEVPAVAFTPGRDRRSAATADGGAGAGAGRASHAW